MAVWCWGAPPPPQERGAKPKLGLVGFNGGWAKIKCTVTPALMEQQS